MAHMVSIWSQALTADDKETTCRLDTARSPQRIGFCLMCRRRARATRRERNAQNGHNYCGSSARMNAARGKTDYFRELGIAIVVRIVVAVAKHEVNGARRICGFKVYGATTR